MTAAYDRFDAVPRQHFRCISADPPWRYRTWSETNQHKSASKHYDLMTTEAIAQMPVSDLATDDCVLFLWAINPMLPHALEVMDAWGFKYSTVAFTWAKTTTKTQFTWAPKWHIGLGHWTRANTELCLLGTRGKPKRNAKDVRQLLLAPRREHSRKPDEFFSEVQRLVSGPYLELFSRTDRPGWSTFGNEVGKFNESSSA